MFTAEAGDWILISHSTFTRCTYLTRRRQTRQRNGTLLAENDMLSNWEKRHSLLSSLLHFHSTFNVFCSAL